LNSSVNILWFLSCQYNEISPYNLPLISVFSTSNTGKIAANNVISIKMTASLNFGKILSKNTQQILWLFKPMAK